jgi:uncharacterized protein with von Willebrand factor type A (vWA) domain
MNTSGEWFEELQAQAEIGEWDAIDPGRTGATAPVVETLREQHPEQHVISGNRYDEYLYGEVATGVDALSSTLSEARPKYGQTDTLAGDILRAFYQLEPHEQQEVDPAYQCNAAAIHDMLSTADYKRLHSLTQLDGFASALSTATMTEALIDVLVKHEQEDRRRERAAKKQQQTQPVEEGLPGAAGQPGDGAGVPGGSGQGKDQENTMENLRAMQRRVAARTAAKKAEVDIAEAQDALDTFSGQPDAVGGGWGSERGHAHLVGDVQARAKLAMRIMRDQTLRHIALLCGRMKMIAAQVERSRLTLGNTELYGVTLGNDVRNLLPTELALLGQPTLKRLFYVRFAERSLNQYERYTPEPVGRGPIIVAVDESGSMGGQKNEWAKAVVLSLLSIAAKQKRDLRVIHFGSAHELLVEDFKEGKGTTEQVINTALHFFAGGTDYERWMREALSAIESSAFDRADVVAVSDGECAVSDELLKQWQAAKTARGFRCVGILTGTPRGGAILRQFCDETHHLKSVREDQAVLEQVFTMTV